MKTRIFVALKPADDSLPNQAATIVTVLTNSGGKAPRDVLLRGLSGQLKTTQPVSRVLSFYRSMLLERGYITEEDADQAPVQVEKADHKPEMKTVSVVEVDFPGDSPLKLKVLRGFKSGDSVTLVCGTDVEDHDVWKVDGGKALLVGVVKRDRFPEVLKAKELNLDRGAFEWVQSAECLPLVGKHTNKTGLHVEDRSFEFQDVACSVRHDR